MTALSLFPARVQAVNSDGTFTPEVIRAFSELFRRAGGALGDGSELEMILAPFMGQEPSEPEMLMQPDQAHESYPDVVQSPETDYTAGTGLNLVGRKFNLADTAVTPGTYGDASNVMQATVDQQGRLTGAASVPIAINSSNTAGANFSGNLGTKTTTIVNGLITSVV